MFACSGFWIFPPAGACVAHRLPVPALLEIECMKPVVAVLTALALGSAPAWASKQAAPAAPIPAKNAAPAKVSAKPASKPEPVKAVAKGKSERGGRSDKADKGDKADRADKAEKGGKNAHVTASRQAKPATPVPLAQAPAPQARPWVPPPPIPPAAAESGRTSVRLAAPVAAAGALGLGAALAASESEGQSGPAQAAALAASAGNSGANPSALSASGQPLATQTTPPQRPSRTVARAYAMDGATFYQNGRKFRVQGLDAREPGMTSEHATQRLQQVLDAGSLSIEPVEVDGTGQTLAVVRVNGRNVADTVRYPD